MPSAGRSGDSHPTGTYKTVYGIEIEPSAKVYALWEHENGYTDSLGTFQADRNFSSGRASTAGSLCVAGFACGGFACAGLATSSE